MKFAGNDCLLYNTILVALLAVYKNEVSWQWFFIVYYRISLHAALLTVSKSEVTWQ